MKLVIHEDEEGNTELQMDAEGMEYLLTGINQLATHGGIFSTPAIWSTPAPWWRFWNRKATPIVGEIRLLHVLPDVE